MNIKSIVTLNNHIFIGTFAGVYKSTDYGLNWNLIRAGYNEVLAVNGNNIYSGFADLYLSADGGSTWESRGKFPTNIYSVEFCGDEIYTGTARGLFISQDNGLSWRRFESGLPSIVINKLFCTSGYIFAGTRANGLWRQKLADLLLLNASPGKVTIDDPDNSSAVMNIHSNSSWTIQSNQSWLTPGTLSGSGNASITLTAGQNVSRSPRDAVITVSGTGQGNKNVVVSQDGTSIWEEINDGVYGGSVYDLKADLTTGKIFAAVCGAGLYRSGNSGDTWTCVNSTLVGKYINTIGIKGNNILAGSSNEGIFISTDYGVTFNSSNAGLTNNSITSIEVTASGIFAGTYGGVFLSTNDGATWTAVNNGLPQSNPAVHSLAVNGSRLFAGTFEGIFISTDNGNNWTATTGIGHVNSGLTSIIVDGSNLYGCAPFVGVFKSTDNGSNWIKVNAGLNALNVWKLLAVPSGILAATGNGLFASENHGASWSSVNTLLNLRTLVYHDGKLFAGLAPGGIYRSSDNGSTLTRSYSGIKGSRISNFTSVGDNLFALSSGEVLKSIDKGITWNVINSLPSLTVNSLNACDNILFASVTNGLYKSIDKGVSWISVNGIISTLKCIVNHHDALYAGTSTGVFASEDGGAHWTQVNYGLSGTSLRIASMLSMDDKLYAGTEGNGVFLLKDGWTTWQPVSTGLNNSTLSVNNIIQMNNVLYIGLASGGIFKSTDGISWHELNTGIPNLNVKSLVLNGNTIFASTNQGMFYSNDSDNSWAQMNTGLKVYNLDLSQAAISHGYLYTGSSYNGIWRHLISEKYLVASSGTIAIEEVSGNFDIFSNTDWDIECPVSWLLVTPSSGSNNNLVLLTAQANTESGSRSTELTISGTDALPLTVNVTQTGFMTDIQREELAEISIYPIPALNTLYIKGITDNAGISVFDVNGKLMLTKHFKGDALNLSELKSGNYLLKIDTGKQTIIKRFVKQ